MRMRKAWRRSVKVEFLRKWMKGVGKYRCVKRKMNLLERNKKVIKVSADIGMASTRKGTRYCWRRALIASACSSSKMKKGVGPSHTTSQSWMMLTECDQEDCDWDGIARRTRKLKRLVPGGDLMDDVSLVEQTLHYIQSLRLRLLLMRSLLTSNSHLINLS